MDICIIGAGLSGLSAAYYLKNKGCINSITILEKNDKAGGCLSSSKAGKGYIEDLYHHCFAGDNALFALLRELGIYDELEWLSGSTGYYVNGKVHPLTTPAEIIKYPHLSFMDKYRLAMLTLGAKKYDINDYDDVSAKDFAVQTCKEGTYKSFFEPLLNGKFGNAKEKVSAAWLISRIAIRSDRKTGGEKLGYMKNGWNTLIEALISDLSKSGCKIHLNTPVSDMKQTENGKWIINGNEYDAVISTVSPAVLEKISGLDIQKKGKIHYQGSACMTIGLEREVTNGIYWLNIKDKAPYGAVIGHTNFVSPQRYGEHIVYLASYFCGSAPENLEEDMISDFCTKFSVKRDEIHWHRLHIDSAAGPVYTKGYKKKLIGHTDFADKKLFTAGMFSPDNYPERSMEGSIKAGIAAAEELMEVL